ncbi:hypothetical protein, partial [Enterobacter intestinihominis]
FQPKHAIPNVRICLVGSYMFKRDRASATSRGFVLGFFGFFFLGFLVLLGGFRKSLLVGLGLPATQKNARWRCAYRAYGERATYLKIEFKRCNTNIAL